jgi:putative peptide zinc metalloprotease protein
VTLSLNPALYIHPFDAASDRALFICEVPAQKDTSLRFAVPAELIDLLKLFDGRRQTSEVVNAYGQLHPGKYTAEMVGNLVESFFIPKGLLLDDEGLAPPPARSLRRPAYIYAKLRLIPAWVIHPVARAFGWAFGKPVLLAWLPVFVALHVLFYFWILPANPLTLRDLTGPRFVEVMLLSLLAAFVHETGHASALISYGCKQTEIGVGLYIYFPVLYTDVSEAWKLGRYKRAMIDAAGIYFQSAFLLLLLVLFWINGSTTLLYAFLFIDLVIARTLNPFLRMDGYWLVADLFGIFNLREQSTNLLRYYVLKPFRPGLKMTAPLSSLSRAARATLGVYTVFCTAFFFYMVTIMVRMAVFYLLPDYPKHLLALWQVARANPVSFQLLGMVFELLWRSLIIFGLAYFAYGLARSLWGILKAVAHSVVSKLWGKPNLEGQSAGRL